MGGKMPYYSLQVRDGEDADFNDLKGMYPDGRPADYAKGRMLYVHRPFDIATLKRNIAGLGENGSWIEVKRITKREFEWKKHQ
ncbi:hypothetical protein DBR17_08530 [Sphingomonas sp. HMWF008]|nr:hypothetical protein DBR17_08530 [Sphingomonas sp. HMWF008]